MSHGYLVNPTSFGYQLPHRYTRTGRLKFHALGCSVDGGAGLPAGVCRKCADSYVDQFYRSMMRIEKRARETL